MATNTKLKKRKSLQSSNEMIAFKEIKIEPDVVIDEDMLTDKNPQTTMVNINQILLIFNKFCIIMFYQIDQLQNEEHEQDADDTTQVPVVASIKNESELIIEDNDDSKVIASQRKVGGILILRTHSTLTISLEFNERNQ